MQCFRRPGRESRKLISDASGRKRGYFYFEEEPVGGELISRP